MHDQTPDGESESAQSESAETTPSERVIEIPDGLHAGLSTPEPGLQPPHDEPEVAPDRSLPVSAGEDGEPNAAGPGLNGESATGLAQTEMEPPISEADLEDGSQTEDSIADVETKDEVVAGAAAPAPNSGADDNPDAAGAFDTEARLLDEMIASRTPISFRDTWSRIHDLQERVRTAPALAPRDAASLQSDLRGIAVALRERQKSERKQASAVRASLRESIDLAREAVDTAQSIADLHESRTDMLLIKEHLTKDGHVLDRATRQVLWESLQEVNQKAWDCLTAAWEDNRRMLEEMLQQAVASLEARDARAAREQIKAFHATLGEVECSHRTQHDLQATARRLWQQASDLAYEKRAAYLVHAARRVDDWKRALRRQDATRLQVEADIRALEHQASAASTDVAAALVRGQLNERRKALRDLENSVGQLRKQIEDAQPRTQKPDVDLDSPLQESIDLE